MILLSFIDPSHISKTTKKAFEMLDEAVENIGLENFSWQL